MEKNSSLKILLRVQLGKLKDLVCSGWEAGWESASEGGLAPVTPQPEVLLWLSPEAWMSAALWRLGLLLRQQRDSGLWRWASSICLDNFSSGKHPWAEGCSWGCNTKAIHFNTLEPSRTLQKSVQEKAITPGQLRWGNTPLGFQTSVLLYHFDVEESDSNNVLGVKAEGV